MNADTLYYVHRSVVPAAFSLLPAQMSSRPAHAMLLAIGLQESGFQARVQAPHGPAHGFWQFEQAGGVHGVLTGSSAMTLLAVLHTMNYRADEVELYRAIVHNDVLACVMARLLLWSLPASLPNADEPDKGWHQYLAAWRPGKPQPVTWPQHFEEACRHASEST